MALKHYPEEFKADAVALFLADPANTYKRIAADLGISRGTLRNWVLDHQVTEIEMTERQFWNFVQLQPVAEKPWATYMGRALRVPDMPEEAQNRLGIFDKAGPGSI